MSTSSPTGVASIPRERLSTLLREMPKAELHIHNLSVCSRAAANSGCGCSRMPARKTH